MGKYTSLARKTEEAKPQENGVVTELNNTYKHTIVVDTGSNAVSTPSKDSTNLRTTNLTNLTEATAPQGQAVVGCIHGTSVESCAVCSGYARWLANDEGRLRKAQSNPEAVRREFWRAVRGGEV